MRSLRSTPRALALLAILLLVAPSLPLAGATAGLTPSPPQNLVATGGPDAGQITLTWDPPAGLPGVTGYRIYRATSAGAELAETDVGTVQTFTDSNLPRGTTYYYKVSAFNLFGEGPQSNEANATTFDLPGAPLDLHAGPAGATAISLTWGAPTSDGGTPITGYDIYRGTASGQETFLVQVGTTTAYTDSGLAQGVTYSYKVSAVNLVGEGPLSNEASSTTATVPSAPTSFVAAPGTNVGDIDLHWSLPVWDGGSTITGYTLYRDGVALAAFDANTFSWTDKGRTPATEYSYVLTASNAVGEGPGASACSMAFPWVATAPVPSCLS